MPVNQRTIADTLQLSIATVSKSLRNSPEIHPDTRAQVIEAASRLGYRGASDRLGKTIKTKPKALDICFMVQSDATFPSPVLQHPLPVLAGLSEAAMANDVSLSVHCVPLAHRSHIAERAFQPVAMREGRFAGLVLQQYFGPEVVEALSRQIPLVHMVHHYEHLRVDCVDLDIDQAMVRIVQRLYALGHRRIGFLGSILNIPWRHARFAAYVQAILKAGLPFDPNIADVDLDTGTGDPAVVSRIIQQTRDGVTAWIAPSDAMAYGWVQRFVANGIRVPEDVSITGIDGSEAPSGLPKLTSSLVPWAAMGRAALLRLVDRIREPAAPIQRVSFRCEFVEGQTIAPPRIQVRSG